MLCIKGGVAPPSVWLSMRHKEAVSDPLIGAPDLFSRAVWNQPREPRFRAGEIVGAPAVREPPCPRSSSRHPFQTSGLLGVIRAALHLHRSPLPGVQPCPHNFSWMTSVAPGRPGTRTWFGLSK